MAKGLKIAKGNSVQIDVATHPQTITYSYSGTYPYPSSTLTNATVFVGGVGGNPSTDTVSLVIQVNYKTAAGVLKTDGYIRSQAAAYQFNCQSQADSLGTTLTRCTLVGGTSQPTLAASQMYIKCVAPDGTLFFASRITNRYVWKGTGASAVRYPYVSGTTAAVTYIDTSPGITFTNKDGGVEGPFAVVESF